MNLEPILEAPFIIQVHFLSALPALIFGPFAIWGGVKRATHKIVGYIWVCAMAVLALSGLFIPSNDLAFIGHVGPIHAFSLFALWGITRGIMLARCGRISEHQAAMRSTWFGSMGIAALLNFLPGRTVNQMVFGGPSDAGWIVICLGLMGLLWIVRRPVRPFRKALS